MLIPHVLEVISESFLTLIKYVWGNIHTCSESVPALGDAMKNTS
jgi:hypothetical protein